MAIIHNLPNIFQYIVPGSICLLTLKFAKQFTIDAKIFFGLSCVFSYILKTIVELLRISGIYKIEDVLVDSFIATSIGFVLCVITAGIINTRWFAKITVALFRRTPNHDIWEDVINFKNGSFVKVYVKGKEYYYVGTFEYKDDQTDDPWLAISMFSKFGVSTNECYKSEPSYINDEKAIAMIRIADIDHVELFS